MRTVFEIDVSKASSEVAILVNGEKIHGYNIPNDTIGLNRLLGNLKPSITLSLSLNGYAYTRFNPLEAKKQLNSLHIRKTDKIDTETLAQSQFVLNRKPTHVQEEV